MRRALQRLHPPTRQRRQPCPALTQSRERRSESPVPPAHDRGRPRTGIRQRAGNGGSERPAEHRQHRRERRTVRHAVTLAKKAGLVGALSGSGPLTVFAPTDAAFKSVPKATLAKLANDKAALRRVLLYHVVKGNVTAARVVKLQFGHDARRPVGSGSASAAGTCSSTGRRRSSRPTSPRATAPSTSSTRCSCRPRSSGIRRDDAAALARRIVASLSDVTSVTFLLAPRRPVCAAGELWACGGRTSTLRTLKLSECPRPSAAGPT